jgi:replicative DNA helicase
MQQELEQRLISSITNEKIFGDIIIRGVSSEDFIMHTEVFSFIQTYYNKYNAIPAKAVIETSFPGFTYIDGVKEDEVKFLCDEVIKSAAKRKAIVMINETVELMPTDTYGAIDSLVARLTGIRKTAAYCRAFADADALKRYDKVISNKDRVKKGITVGIKTGISLFDEKYIGWQPGNLVGIVSRLKVGKSWLALYLGCQAYKSGKRVLFLSPEMGVDEVHLRWDTLMGKLNGYDFMNTKLQTGDVNFKSYKGWLEQVSERKDWLTLDSVNGKKFNLVNINGLINEFSPDLVVMDGIALMDVAGTESWQKVMDISYGLKALAQNHKIVIVATNQVNRSVGMDEMPTPEQVAFGDTFMQACDVGIFIQQKVNHPDVRFITIPIRRNGKAINTPVQIQFEVNNGIISV